jgi:hypothetical protein
MDHRPAAVGGEHLEADRPGEMGDNRAVDRLDPSGHLTDGAIGGRDHQQVDIPCLVPSCGAEVVTPAQRREHPPTHLGQRSSE